jgi:low affinity Fe/Cu permease
MNQWFDRLARQAERWVGSSWAFVLACALIVVWGITGPWFHWSDTWQIVINTATTIITFLMVFLIQATQTRDTTAIHVKLDELLRAVEGARTGLGAIEDMDRDQLEAVRDELRETAKSEQSGGPPLAQ